MRTVMVTGREKLRKAWDNRNKKKKPALPERERSPEREESQTGRK